MVNAPYLDNEHGDREPPFFDLFGKSWSLPYCLVSFKKSLSVEIFWARTSLNGSFNFVFIWSVHNGARFMLVEITRYWHNRQNVSINSSCVIYDIELQVSLLLYVSHVLLVSEPKVCMKLQTWGILVRSFSVLNFQIMLRDKFSRFSSSVILKYYHTRLHANTKKIQLNLHGHWDNINSKFVTVKQADDCQIKFW